MNVYVVFSKTGTWLSNVLRVYLKEKYVHVSLSFDDKFDYMYSFGRTNPNNPFSGGFVIENLNGGVYKRNRESECIIYKFEVSKDQYDEILLELNKYEKRREDLKYNALGLITAMFNIEKKRKNHYFCTQFAAELFIKTGVFNSQKPPELFRPQDILLNIKDYKKIYEGYVIDYVNNKEGK